MINSFGIENCSLILSAIDQKQKYPLDKLNPKNLENAEEPSLIEICEAYRKHNLLKYISFSPHLEQKESLINEELAVSPIEGIDYFYQKNFDTEQDYPCRDLIKYIEQERE